MRDTTRAFRIARDIRLSLPVKLLTPRIVKLFDRLETILDRIDKRVPSAAEVDVMLARAEARLRKEKPKLRKRTKARTKP